MLSDRADSRNYKKVLIGRSERSCSGIGLNKMGEVSRLQRCENFESGECNFVIDSIGDG